MVNHQGFQKNIIHIPIWSVRVGFGGVALEPPRIAYWKPIRAIVIDGILAIHAPGKGYRRKNVTHIATGAIVATVPNVDQAIALCHALLASPINWHREHNGFSQTEITQIKLIQQEICRLPTSLPMQPSRV